MKAKRIARAPPSYASVVDRCDFAASFHQDRQPIAVALRRACP